MSGYETWKRQSSVFPNARTQSQYGSRTWSEPLSEYFPLNQVTDSYRTGDSFEIAPSGSLETLSVGERKTPYDNGHEFLTNRDHFAGNTRLYRFPTRFSNAWHEGPIVPSSGHWDATHSVRLQDVHTFFPSYTRGELNSLGARAIAKSNPLAPEAGIAQFLGELREGLPSLVLQTVSGFKKRNPFNNAGSDFLNYQFGLVPLVSDLKKMLRSVLRSTEIINHVLEHSGKPVSGSFGFPVEQKTHVSTLKSNLLGSPVFPNWSTSRMDEVELPYLYDSTTTTTMTRKAWFKGSFIYHVPNGDSLIEKAKAYELLANKLLGTRITASTLWELSPWSWLVDWQYDVGDVISNYASFQGDGLVLRYGYLMDTTRWDISVSTKNPGIRGLPSTFDAHWWRIQKRRTRSTPYGFGSNPGDFSSGQWAILAALGMTKTPRSLR